MVEALPSVNSQPEPIAPGEFTPLVPAGGGIVLAPGERLVLPPNAVPPNSEIAKPPKIWEGSFDLGVNGTEGNSQNFNLRSGAKLKRTLPDGKLSLSLDYANNSADAVETANRAFFEGRNEWLFKESPWTWYIHETTEYDEFKPWDLRITFDTGIGYQIYKDELTSLIGRTGPGTSHEIDGPDDGWVPELNFGLAFERKLSKRQKVNVEVDYIPDVSDLNDYRINSQINWELLVDDERHISLKVGILDRYDSTPNGASYNDLDYKAVVVWSF